MTEPREILVVEDEPGLRELIGDLLQTTGARVHLVASLAEADAFLARRAPDLVLSDVRLPDGDGLSWIERRRAAGHRGPVLVMTAYGTVDRAVRALRIGATDFLVKPFDNERLLGAVHAALAGQEELDEVELRAPTVGDTEAGRSLIGAHGGLADVVALLPRVAASDATVLVLGESGTGKELVARAIHRASARMDGPFVSLNCAAIPSTLLEAELFGFERGAFTGAHAQRRGHIEAASGGTLFLDEIGDMALEAQAKLLRVLQERAIVRVGGRDRVEVDVRVVAATHRDLVAAAAEGRFREDLMYRLDVVRIELPPLRARRQDLRGLVDYFVTKLSRRHRVPPPRPDAAVWAALEAHDWPGNVRELENWVERAVVMGRFDAAGLELDRARRSQAPASADAAPRPSLAPSPETAEAGEPETVRPLREVVREAERRAVVVALRAARGNKAEAARLLGVSYKTLFNKIHEYDIVEETTIL